MIEVDQQGMLEVDQGKVDREGVLCVPVHQKYVKGNVCGGRSV